MSTNVLHKLKAVTGGDLEKGFALFGAWRGVGVANGDDDGKASYRRYIK